MNDLNILNEQEVLGKHFKVYGTLDNPLFIAKEVAEWIDYSKREDGSYNTSAMISTVDDDEKIKIHTAVNNSNGGSDTWFLTEDGLYEVLMQSRKPIAKQFKKKVKEILKNLRKNGGYISNKDLFVDTYFDDMPDEQKKIMRGLLSSIEEKQKKIKNLECENDLLTQKTLEWADRPIINALVRSYAHSINNDYAAAWREFKKELLYRYGINLNARRTSHLNNGGSKSKATLDFIADEELQQAISTAVAMCRNNNVDISEIIGKKAS